MSSSVRDDARLSKQVQVREPVVLLGGGGSHGVRYLTNLAIPLETFAPYKSQEQMDQIRLSIPAAGALAWSPDPATNPNTQDNVDAFEYSPLYIPLSARQNANYSVASYVLLDQAGARDTARLEGLIAAGNEVIVDLDLKWKRDLYSWDTSLAAGNTVWSGTPFGLWLTRGTDTSPFPSVFNRNKWLGAWSMNHDGWRGTLSIHRLEEAATQRKVSGVYYDSAGVATGVTGYIDKAREHVAQLTMFGQSFVLHYHTWSDGLFSGYTFWGGRRFGAHGRMMN